MADYDKYYETEDLFGAPYPELIEFFEQYVPKGKLIDLGCGQGRNAISLARLGYKITGIDISKVGIDQMNSISEKEGLNITGLTGDIYSFDNYQDFDIVLLDSMFHFEQRDKKRETVLISKIAKQIKKEGLICICIQDTGDKVSILKNTIKNSGIAFEVLNDSSLIYEYEDKASGHKSETKYCIYIVKKINDAKIH
ncbi:methyltransferase domain-containing protein [Flexithrix dorotheae]|uniref:methyltransferase domain-containing protein n=1 Tax=Flexithrix dorotheae TaxID=70993 RepID=UPI00037D0A9A|nr:methyltransferase domain-containing protein [Flexithrix dorotheae]